MKILFGCHSINSPAGSELYHYELLKSLSNTDNILYLGVFHPLHGYHPDSKFFNIKSELESRGVNIFELNNLCPEENEFDIIVTSQPHVTKFLCNKYPNKPKISIIHSIYRSEDIVHHPSIKHYIAQSVFVYKNLKNNCGISSKNISLIYNPVDPNKFNTNHNVTLEKITGLFVGGGENDLLRHQIFLHIAQECINNNWDLFHVGGYKTFRPIEHPNIKYFDGFYNTELLTKHVNFTVGLGGRSTIEGWMCGKPSYIYKVDKNGNILHVSLKYPPKTYRFESNYVSNQHIKLYKTILSNL